jgi:integrase
VDVEFAGKGRIRVQPREGERGWKPKTRRSVRDVPMSAELRRILLAHAADGYAGETYLIRGPQADQPLSRFTVDRWVEADFLAVGLPYGRDGGGLTYHSLRHSAASWMAQRDVSLLKIAKILGDTVSMIEHTYGHLLPTDLDRAVEVLDQHVSEGGL